MDANEAIRMTRERTEHDITLPSGAAATVKLPDQQECILAGGIPMPLLHKMAEEKTEEGPHDLSPEEIAHILKWRHEIARQTLVGLYGERIEGDVTVELIRALNPLDREALVAIGNRDPGNLLSPTEASVPT